MPTECNHPPTITIEANVRIIRISGNIDRRPSLDEHVIKAYEAQRKMILEASAQQQQEMERLGRWDLKRLEQLQCENRIALLDVEKPICAELLWEWRQTEEYHRAEQRLGRAQRILAERKKGPEIKWSSSQGLRLLSTESGGNVQSSEGKSCFSRERSPRPLIEDRLESEDMVEVKCPEDDEKDLMSGRAELKDNADSGADEVTSEDDDWSEWCERARGVTRLTLGSPVLGCSISNVGGVGVNGIQDSVQSPELEEDYYFS